MTVTVVVVVVVMVMRLGAQRFDPAEASMQRSPSGSTSAMKSSSPRPEMTTARLRLKNFSSPESA